MLYIRMFGTGQHQKQITQKRTITWRYWWCD